LGFAVAGGPLAWFLQLNAGYALANFPCFPGDQRMTAPLEGYGWSFPTMVAALVAGVLISLASTWASWRTLQRTRRIGPDEHRDLLEIRTSRTRFLAEWGVIYGIGFALTTLLTCVAFIVMPRCGG
jgi:hypothetical protein